MNIVNITVLLMILITWSCSQPNQQKEQEISISQVITPSNKYFDFENYKTGEKPAGWSTALTGKGNPCDWKILNDSGNKILAQVSNETQGYRFNLIVNDSLNYKDVTIQVKFKGVLGRNDQGGGPVWRYIDANNYYVARANPLENNFRLYKVVNGNRKELKSADISINTNQWYQLKIIMKGNKIQCFFDNKLALETTDDTFMRAGKIGLWTKSDAITYFDDLDITTW